MPLNLIPLNLIKLLLPVVIVAVAALSFTWLRSTRPQAEPKPVEERIWTVASIDIEHRDLRPQIEIFGEVRAASVAELRPMVSGRLIQVSPHLLDGAVVSEGQLLASIDPFEYQIAVTEREADVREITARIDELDVQLNSERKLITVLRQQQTLRMQELERQNNLKTRGTASEKARDEAALAVNAAEQSLLASRQRIEQLQSQVRQQQAALERAEAQLSRAQRDLRDTEILAPFNGFLSNVSAALGQRVQTGDRLARLIDAQKLEVVFQLTAEQYARLLQESEGRFDGLVGRPVHLHWDTGRDSFSYQARIDRVNAEIDAASGGIDLHAVLEHSDQDSPLRPGAFVRVSLQDRLYRRVVLLPDSAIIDRQWVYLIDAQQRLQQIAVTPMRRLGPNWLVTTELPSGSRVVRTGFPEIAPGLKVRIRSSALDSGDG